MLPGLIAVNRESIGILLTVLLVLWILSVDARHLHISHGMYMCSMYGAVSAVFAVLSPTTVPHPTLC